MESATVPLRKNTFKVRLSPNAAQRELTNKTVGCARFVYNHYLALRTSTYRDTGRGMTYRETDKHLTTLTESSAPSRPASVLRPWSAVAAGSAELAMKLGSMCVS